MQRVEDVLEYAANSPKFWFLQDIQNLLLKMGMNTYLSNVVVFIIAAVIVAGLMFLLNQLIYRMSALFVPKNRVQLNGYDILVKKRFFNRLLVFIALWIVLLVSDVLFAGFLPDWIRLEIMVMRSIVIIWGLLVLYALLNALEKYTRLHPKTKGKTLKGHIQIVKLSLTILAGVFIISVLTGRSKAELFVGFGAMAAFITFVFRDTILGFVASIQLSSQDMLQLGDWIEMPSKNANGHIVDINLSSVKVQNWDNSVTMLPINAMVTDSFTNMRRMELGPGRRFVRTFRINIDCVRRMDEEEQTALSQIDLIVPYWADALALAQVSSPKGALTNLAIFRAYTECYLRSHPEINNELMLFVRYMPDVGGSGMGLEVYAFSRQKGYTGYDLVQRTVMEQIIATAPLFGLTFFQTPSGQEVQQIRRPLN